MSNNTCEDCKSFPGMGYYCPIDGRFCDPNNEKPCEYFEKPFGRKMTNGDKIRQMSNEELMVYLDCTACIYAGHDCASGVCECADGKLKWLNAPAESEG